MSDGSNKDPQRALVFATGDIIVDEPDPYSFFEPSRELLSSRRFCDRTDRGSSYGPWRGKQYGHSGTACGTGKFKSIERLWI